MTGRLTPPIVMRPVDLCRHALARLRIVEPHQQAILAGRSVVGGGAHASDRMKVEDEVAGLPERRREVAEARLSVMLGDLDTVA